jgi:DNA-binding response OmpR family regulator
MPGATILIVEDDANLALLIGDDLKRAGYAAHVATEGVQALNLARQLRPALIVLDFLFPAGGGGSLLKRIRMSTHTQKFPVLILSAVPEDLVRKEIGPDPATRYLGKPYSKDVLLETIAKILGEAPPQPGAKAS